MDQANRFVVVTSALLVAFLAILIVLLAWAAPSASIDRIADLAGWLRRHDDGATRVVVTLASAVLLLLMVMAISSSLRRRALGRCACGT